MFLRCFFGRRRVVDVPVAVVPADVVPRSEHEAVQAALRHVEQKLRDAEAELEQTKAELEVANNSLQHVSVLLQSNTHALEATDALLQKSQNELAKAAKECLDTTVLLHGEQYKNEELRKANGALQAKLADYRLKIDSAEQLISLNCLVLTNFLRQHGEPSADSLRQSDDASETATTPDPSEDGAWEGQHNPCDEFSE